MNFVKVGTIPHNCPMCKTPVVEKDGRILYCFGEPIQGVPEGSGKKAVEIHAQQAQVHDCDRDAEHYRAELQRTRNGVQVLAENQ